MIRCPRCAKPLTAGWRCEPCQLRQVLTECGGLVPLAAAEARRLVAYDGYITTYDPHPNGIAALAHGRQEP